MQTTTNINSSNIAGDNNLSGLSNSNYDKKIVNRLELAKPITIALTNRKLKTKSYDDFFTQKEPKLPEVPKIKLPNGSIANDYSSDYYFAKRMEQMSLKESENIRAQVNQYPDIYPMPCMAITTEAIKQSIKELHKQFNLTAKQQQLFNEIIEELNQLFPSYPYKKSFVIAYKFILYKSFLEYNYTIDDYNSDTDTTPKQLAVNRGKEIAIIHATVANTKIYDHLQKYAGIKSISSFQKKCTLNKIKNLPWDQLLSKNDIFKKELLKLYFNIVYYRLGSKLNAFMALCSNEVLIPYAQELTIDFFNKTYSLPLWLVGYAVNQELINADDYNMSSSGFFEHDLHHLTIKLHQTNDTDQNAFKHFFKIARLIYQNKNLITTANFKAIELCLFSMAHEQGLIFKYDDDNVVKSIAKVFQNTYDSADLISIPGIPLNYNTSNIDIKKASYFLTQLINNDFSEFQLVKTLAKNINYNFLETENDIMPPKFITIDPGNCEFIEDIIQQIKHNKNIFEQYNFSSSKIIGILRLYYKKLVKLYIDKKITLLTLKQAEINEKVLLSVELNLPIEKKLILHFLQTDKLLNYNIRWQIACKEVAKISAEHQIILDMIKKSNPSIG